jgi:hypothetical protein
MKRNIDNKFPRWGHWGVALLFAVLCTIIIALRSRFFCNDSFFVALLSGIFLFAFYEYVFVFVINKYSASDNPRQLINVYLAAKVGRILFALLYVTSYVLIVKQEIKLFVLVFVLIYFVYLLFDTLLLSSWEKNKMKKE